MKAPFTMVKLQLPRLKWQILTTFLKRWKPQAASRRTATPYALPWLANRKKILKNKPVAGLPGSSSGIYKTEAMRSTIWGSAASAGEVQGFYRC